MRVHDVEEGVVPEERRDSGDQWSGGNEAA
jgi:hypothetical protein